MFRTVSTSSSVFRSLSFSLPLPPLPPLFFPSALPYFLSPSLPSPLLPSFLHSSLPSSLQCVLRKPYYGRVRGTQPAPSLPRSSVRHRTLKISGWAGAATRSEGKATPSRRSWGRTSAGANPGREAGCLTPDLACCIEGRTPTQEVLWVGPKPAVRST